MRTYAKKKECVNAPIGPCTTFSHCAYGYNIRNELISAAKSVGASSPTNEYAYQYDDIGNRISSFDLGTNRTYTASNLNQYTLISNLCDSVTLRETFIPQFDDDMRPRRRLRVARRSEATEPRSGRKRPRNETLVHTATGIWQIQYNNEENILHGDSGVDIDPWPTGGESLFGDKNRPADIIRYCP